MKHLLLVIVYFLSFNHSSAQTEITDSDNDTKVQTEANTDEDIIRFTLGGAEQFRMDGATLEVVNSSNSVYIGSQVGKLSMAANARNVGIGNEALKATTSADQNTAIGANAMRAMITGEQNVAIGEAAMLGNQSGTRNTIVGQSAMRVNLSGSNNAALGEEALYFCQGNNNTALGREAGEKTGDGGVFLGYQAGKNETGHNKLYIDNTDTPSPLIYGEFDNDLIIINGTCDITSDQRLKYNIEKLGYGLSQITALNGYSYKRKNIVDTAKTELGVLAQEVENIMPELVNNNREGLLTVNYSGLIPVLIEAIKELKLEITNLQEQLNILQNK